MNISRSIIRSLEKLALILHTNSESAVNWLRVQKYFLDFEEREDDVYVASYLKSGTTWMQMILYQMLHEGGDAFEHLYDVSPWPANDAYLDKSPAIANGLAGPRILKTHNRYSDFRKDVKCRFVYVHRNGMDVASSLFHHTKNYLDPDVSFDQVFKKHFENTDDNWFLFNQAWLENENGLNILYISYEQMKTDLDTVVKNLAAFLHVELTDKMLHNIRTYASFEHMKKNETKFGERPGKESRLVYNQFLRKGETGDGATYLSAEQKTLFTERYRQILSGLVKSEAAE